MVVKMCNGIYVIAVRTAKMYNIMTWYIRLIFEAIAKLIAADALCPHFYYELYNDIYLPLGGAHGPSKNRQNKRLKC